MASMKINLSPEELSELLNEHYGLKGININPANFKVECRYEDRPCGASTYVFAGVELEVLNADMILEGNR